LHPLDIAYLVGHASPRTAMIYNNPRGEEIVRQMRAANPSKILAKTSRAAISDRSYAKRFGIPERQAELELRRRRNAS